MTVLPTDFEPQTLACSAAATVTLLDPCARFSLRARPAERGAVAAALRLELPVKIGQRTRGAGAEAMCVGPEEWVVTAPEAEAGRLSAASAEVYAAAPHSLAAIHDREITIRVEGPQAAELLTLGCPRDLDAILPGSGRRTVFDGVSVVLWRDAAQVFRLDVWRSFAPHVLSLLDTGCRELAAD